MNDQLPPMVFVHIAGAIRAIDLADRYATSAIPPADGSIEEWELPAMVQGIRLVRAILAPVADPVRVPMCQSVIPRLIAECPTDLESARLAFEFAVCSLDDASELLPDGPFAAALIACSFILDQFGEKLQPPWGRDDWRADLDAELAAAERERLQEELAETQQEKRQLEMLVAGRVPNRIPQELPDLFSALN